MVTTRDDDFVEVTYNIYFPYSGRKDYLAGMLIKHVRDMLTTKRYPIVLSDTFPQYITNNLNDITADTDLH